MGVNIYQIHDVSVGEETIIKIATLAQFAMMTMRAVDVSAIVFAGASTRSGFKLEYE